MAARRPRKSRARAKIANAFAYLLAAILLLLAAYLGYNWFSFNRGHQAFLQGDCLSAGRYFERVISSWRWLDIGHFRVMAEVETAECRFLLEAIDLERSGKYGQALQRYLEFLESHPESGLSAAIQQRSTALFAQADPYDLVNEVICTSTANLLEKRLIPQRELNLPQMYLSCAHFYDQAQQEQKAYAAYVTFLTEYPDHKSGLDAEAGLLDNPLACQKPELLSDSSLGERPDFIPKLFYTCGLNFESEGNLSSAIPMFAAFLRAYPEHRFAEQMVTALARSTVALVQETSYMALPQPLGSSAALSGLGEVTIQNGSPDPLRVVFYGPQAQVIELEACPDCPASGKCSSNAPTGRFRLPAGDYQVVVQANPDENPTNWLGLWAVQSNRSYSVCIPGR